MNQFVFLTVFLYCSCHLQIDEPQKKTLKVAAFNLKSFGVTKASRPEVMERIVQVIERYDVILLQEIRNKNLEAVVKLYNQLKETSPNFRYKISDPIGRSSYKEQYAYFYRKDRFEDLSPTSSTIYPDPQDIFEREPYLIHLKVKDDNLDFVLIGAHIKPDDAVFEIEELKNVYEYAQGFFGDGDAFLLGDLNADCSYMNRSELDQAFFNNDERFKSFIDRNVDTTTKNSTDCAYDRIIGTTELSLKIEAGSAKTFNFTKEWNLSEEEALGVSDHFPVEFTLNYGE